MHLSAAYRKLEISSRAALPQTLRSSTVAKREQRPHPGGMTTTDGGAPMPFDTDLRAGASRMRWASLSGRARGHADSERPPLVLLHGLTFDRRMWDPILDALPDAQQAIAFDLPGHGSSTARQIVAAGVPYLVLSREPLSPEDEAWLLERIPGAELAVWPVGHHFPQLERPEGFAALVVAFAEGARV
jgi:pimeloyl-ACP methyl ester carboxylesterase